MRARSTRARRVMSRRATDARTRTGACRSASLGRAGHVSRWFLVGVHTKKTKTHNHECAIVHVVLWTRTNKSTHLNHRIHHSLRPVAGGVIKVSDSAAARAHPHLMLRPPHICPPLLPSRPCSQLGHLGQAIGGKPTSREVPSPRQMPVSSVYSGVSCGMIHSVMFRWRA